MSKKNDRQLNRDEDWGEYKKSSKKKIKNWEEQKDWKFDKRNHIGDEDDYYEDSNYKVAGW
jgi:hypothetical protein